MNSETLPLVCYLPPALAYHFNIAIYIHVGAITVLVWDILNNIRNDYKILFHYKFGLQTLVYFITRILLMAFAFGRSVMISGIVSDCGRYEMVLNGLMTVVVATTTLSFYLRVYAIYRDNIPVRVSFGLTWLGTVVGAIGFTQTFAAARLGSTEYCIESIKGHWLGPAALVLVVNDALIYFAMTYRLYILFRDSESTTQQKLKLVIFGTNLPLFSRVVLLESQLYFLVIVATKTWLVIAVYILDAPFNVGFIICHIVLANIFSGRIFRAIKMGEDRFESPSPPKFGTAMKFATGPSSITVQRSVSVHPSTSDKRTTVGVYSIDKMEKSAHSTHTNSNPSYAGMEANSQCYDDKSAKNRVLV